MEKDAELRAALIWLAAAVVTVGAGTQSLNKAGVTYLFGMLGIAGIILPNWDYFDRPVSQWFHPITLHQINPGDVHTLASSTRFRFYPIRTAVYAIIYGWGIYKWWNYITH